MRTTDLHCFRQSLLAILLSIKPTACWVIVGLGFARQEGLAKLYIRAWIALTVHLDLQAMGLAAAFSTALGNAGVGCNVMAGAHHDHIFVPEHQSGQAVAMLRKLQHAARLTSKRFFMAAYS